MNDEKLDKVKDAKTTIPVVEENFLISKNSKLKATYTISKETGYKKQSHDLKLHQEAVDIKEINLNKEISAYPEIRYEGNVTIIPVVEEVEEIRTKLILVKEVHITKSTSVQNERIDTKTRYDKIIITKDGPEKASETEV